MKIIYLKFSFMKTSDMKNHSTIYLSLNVITVLLSMLIYQWLRYDICRIVKAVRSLLMLIPTDTKVLEELDRLTQVLLIHSNNLR